MTAAVLEWVCRAIWPGVLILAVIGADATTWAADTYPHLPWAIARGALAAGALAGGLAAVHATRPRQETR